MLKWSRWSSRKASSRWKGLERFVGKTQLSDWRNWGRKNQLPGGFSQGSPDFLVQQFGRSCFEQLSGGWAECREMFYGVGVRRRCIYVALAGRAARWDSLDGPGTLGTFLTNWLNPPSLSIPPFRFFLLPLSPESLLSNYWRAMSTKVVFAKVLLRCEEATLDKEGSGGRVDRSGKDNGDKQWSAALKSVFAPGLLHWFAPTHYSALPEGNTFLFIRIWSHGN